MGEELTLFDAEVGVAGSILRDSQSYFRVAGTLTEDSFALEIPRLIFHAAGVLASRGQVIEPIPLREVLKGEGHTLTNQTMVEYMEVTPTAANDVLYARQVQEYARRRRLKALGETLCAEEQQDSAALLALAKGELEDIQQGTGGGLLVSSRDMLSGFYENLNARERGTSGVVKTGYPRLDQVLGGGFLKQGLYIIGARPGMGKTMFALNLADQMAGGVLFVSLEMSEEQITARRLARLSGVNSTRLLMGKLTEEEYQKIGGCTARLCESRVVVNRSPTATVAQIGLMARSVKGLSCVLVDYLGLIRGDNPRASLYERTTRISGDLKQLARSLNVPIIALAQLSRESERRTNKRPSLSDLRDSGSIEQDADGVLFLYRPDYYQEEQPKEWEGSYVECAVAKNRHGGCGKVEFNAYLAVSKFEEI